MRFIDPPDASGDLEPGYTRTEFHKLDADIQLAIEELDHTLSNHNAQVTITSCEKGILKMEIWIGD